MLLFLRRKLVESFDCACLPNRDTRAPNPFVDNQILTPSFSDSSEVRKACRILRLRQTHRHVWDDLSYDEAEFARMEAELDEAYEKAAADAADSEPPPIVQAYRKIYWRFPSGWPPA